MAKLTKITIINPNTIRLDEDAKAGDVINLFDASTVDISILDQKIKDTFEKNINQKLLEAKNLFEIEKQNEINQLKISLQEEKLQEINKIKEEIANLKSEIKLQETLKEKDIELVKEKAIIETENLYKETITKLQVELLNKDVIKEKDIELAKEKAINSTEATFKEVINNLKMELLEKEKNHQTVLVEKDKLINDLTLQKSALNIKKIGEQLETWCNNEYETYAQNGFETCTWQKDNEAVGSDDLDKKTKADYIFKVYATINHLETELLTSVACEMKNESPTSVNKKKNSDHYAKLDKDRRKKNCEYALLISELEWDQSNDVPIRKVNGYEKMYMVRPQYFMTFINIIASLSLKFKDLIIDEIKEQETFKETLEIKQEFEKFKSDIIDKPLAKLEKELNVIIDSANNIKKYSDKIIDSSNTLITKTIKDIENKINNFKIDRICKKIDKID